MIRLKVQPKTAAARLTVRPSPGMTLQVSKAKVVTVASDGSLYEGPYLVEPTFDSQTLATKNKTMYADVTVNAIRVERVSNTHGTTVYIGTKGD